MLTLIEGGFSSGLFDEVKKRIKASHEKGREIYLIVPEQQTVIAEAEMTDFMPSDAPLYFEVTNFTRFANTAFRALGGVAGEYCDKVKKTLIMWRALTEAAPVLKSTVSGEISAAAAQKYLSAVSEMQSAGVNAEMLTELSEKEKITTDKRLSNKLYDLGTVMTAYKRLLREKYSDTADDIGNMYIKLTEHPEFLSDTDIYIDGFTSFTEGQYKLISKLSERTDVTLSLIIPKAARDAFEYGETKHTHERLISLGRQDGTEVKLIRIDGRFGKSNELLYELTDKLWMQNAFFDNSCLQNSGVLRICASKNPFEMCDFVCADIRRRVSSGASFSDFAIVSSSADAYAGILDAALKKYRIPAFTSSGRAADEFSAIKLIYSVLRVIKRDFSREDVISYAKCGFSGLCDSDIDAFELYVNSWRIDKKQFTRGDFTMSPYGYGASPNEDAQELLKRINFVRDGIISPIAKLSDVFSNCVTVKDFAASLAEFLIELDMEGQLSLKAGELISDGDLENAEEYSRLWYTVCRALDGLVESVGDMAANAESFLILLKIIFSGVEIGKIPAYTDEVTVGSADMLRLYGKRHIYLIGVNDGEFPRSIGSDGAYFGEKDRAVLADLGIDLSSSTEIKAARELFCFLRAVSYAEDSVTFNYYESNAAMKAKERADAIDRLLALSRNELKVHKTYEGNMLQYIWTPESAQDALGALSGGEYSELKAALSEIGADRIIGIAESPVENDGILLSQSMQADGKKITLSQTKIDTYVDCPMKYFCKYNLGLASDEIYEFGAKEIGTFIHAILESFFRALKKNGGNASALSEAERGKITETAARDYIATLGDGAELGGERMKIRIARLIRAARPVVAGLCDEFSSSDFKPAYLELRLDSKNPALPDKPSFDFEDGEVEISGIIDRMDTMKVGDDVYVRVVDYKTGRKDFSPEDMEKGRNLQMFLYLKAICETESEKFRQQLGVTDSGKILPAGVIYVSTVIDDVKVGSYDEDAAIDAVKKAQKRQGMLLDDSVSIGGMNKAFLPIKFKRGEIDEKSRELLYSLDGWEEIMKTVEGAVADVSERMRRGDIAPNPDGGTKSKPCEYCEFKPVCRKISY